MSKSVSASKKSKISLLDMTRLDGGGRQHQSIKVVEEEHDFMAEVMSSKTLDFCSHDSDDENRMHDEPAPMMAKPLHRDAPSTISPRLTNRPHFPIGRHNLASNADHKRILLGGRNTKRDQPELMKKRDVTGASKCVSEAVLRLSIKDNSEERDDGPVPLKKFAPAKDENVPRPADRNVFSVSHPPPLMRSRSENGIRKIGDHSQEPLLPLIKNTKHPDLKTISAYTLGRLLKKELWADEIEQLWIVDCRYPFEYGAGHIVTAINCPDRGVLQERFLDHPYQRKDATKRLVVVFHCEFSSQRGPDMLRFLRAQDRADHQHCYPKLVYPELYILEGGYKAFFESCRELCDPCVYLPMAAETHKDDCSLYKAKAKSFHGFSVLGAGARK